MRTRTCASLMLLALTFASCTFDPLTLVQIGDGGIPLPIGEDTGVECIPTNNGIEICDGIDNNCDGQIDEGFNLMTNPEHCGSCNKSCLLPGVLSECERGVCRYLGCAPGFYALDNDITNGCEYECTPTGEEICDGIDNDCNGEIDELFDLNTDVENCGACGNVCRLANAVARCVDCRCEILSCKPGFINMDGDDSNGCEVRCEPTNNGVEICDGIDNDCNGVVDDPGGVPIDFDNDPYNCGACGIVCALANAETTCQGGQCVLVSCLGDYVDADGVEANGCECLPSGPEVCDGLDNDCNGLIDDGIPSMGPCGTDEGECVAGEYFCVNGYATCVGHKGPEPEICDGLDNDCNGFIDDNLPILGICGESEGECIPGVLICQNGQHHCSEGKGFELEICDGLDNDCNGFIDDNLPNLGTACGTDEGECQAGVLDCQGGKEICIGSIGPRDEHCDGIDTDCDGQPDPDACLFPDSGRERRLDDLDLETLGTNNSSQLSIAGIDERILAVWLDRRDGRGDIYANISTNGGVSWRDPDIEVAAETNNKSEPVAAFGGLTSTGERRAYVAYARFGSGNQRDIYLRSSTDGGETWGSAVRAERFDYSSGDALFVRLAVAPGATAGAEDTVIVCWERIAVSGAINPNIRCSISRSNGGSFSDANDVRVNEVANNSFVPEIAIDGSYVYVTWQQGTSIRVARSLHTSAPLSFSDERTLNADPGQNPRIAVDGTGNGVIVVWEDLQLPQKAIRANRSSDRGASWLPDGVRLDNDVVDGNSENPVIAVRPGGRIFVAWTDSNRGQPDVYVNFSDDGGLSWNAVQRLATTDPVGAGAHTSARPVIAVSPSNANVYVAWEEYRTGPARDIYFNLSLDNGETWNIPDFRLDETPAGVVDATSPRIWATASRAAVIWLDYRALGPGGALVTGANGDIYSSYFE